MLNRPTNWFPVLAIAAGCTSNATTPDAAPSLRPGVEDSSQSYQGTPDADESAFWVAVRDADDTGRAAAVTQLMADVTTDPTNGYSEFLVAASMFMPPSTDLTAIVNNTQPTLVQASSAVVTYLNQGLSNLTDPFYLGFDGALLGATEIAAGDPADGGAAFATAGMNNHAATDFIGVIGDLHTNNAAGALADINSLFAFCNSGPLDPTGGDAASYVGKMNAASLAHRECYSGYYAPHGSEGELLVLGDIQALNGNAQAATAYYTALQQTASYSTWAMQPLVQRRLSGAEPAEVGQVLLIASTCATCHMNISTLP